MYILGMFVPTMTRPELECLIIGERSLFAMFDEARLLAAEYTDDELRAVVGEWVAAGDECFHG